MSMPNFDFGPFKRDSLVKKNHYKLIQEGCDLVVLAVWVQRRTALTFAA